jgi:hypothetical protein
MPATIRIRRTKCGGFNASAVGCHCQEEEETKETMVAADQRQRIRHALAKSPMVLLAEESDKDH